MSPNKIFIPLIPIPLFQYRIYLLRNKFCIQWQIVAVSFWKVADSKVAGRTDDLKQMWLLYIDEILMVDFVFECCKCVWIWYWEWTC